MNTWEESAVLEAVFLDEIARQPGDETPVLVYADWLMEQDDPVQASRGEFLRLQSVLRHGRPGGQRGDMEWRARDLWWGQIENWLGPLYDAVEHFRYERGLLAVEVCEQTLGNFDVEELARAPAWGWVRHIGVRKGSLQTFVWLSGLPRPPRLASLDVGRRTLRDVDELLALLDLPLQQGLAELDLADNWLGNEGAAALADWPGAQALRKLGLRRTGVGDAGAAVLARSDHLNGLLELHLGENPIHDDGAGALATASGLASLKRLDLSYTDIGWHQVAALQDRYPGGLIHSPAWMRYQQGNE